MTTSSITLRDIPTKTPSTEARLDQLERELRNLRGQYGQVLAEIAANVEQSTDRMDAADRRVAALRQGLNDAVTVIGKHEDRIGANEVDITRVGDRCANQHLVDLGTGKRTMDHTMTYSPVPPGHADYSKGGHKKPFVKGGWVNIYRDRTVGYQIWDTKEDADAANVNGNTFARIRIPDVTEGEGL